MWLVLTENNDPAGAWLTLGLAQRGFAGITQVSRRDLCQLQDWEYLADEDGVWFRMRLASGKCIDSRDIVGVVNRLHPVPSDKWMLLAEEGRGLGAPEMAPTLRACLSSFACPVWNPADLRSMHGGWRHVSEWVHLANQAGLPGLTRQFVVRGDFGLHWLDEGAPFEAGRLASGKFLIVGKEVVTTALSPEPPKEIAQGGVKLAELARTPLLEVTCYVDGDGRWFFRGANTCPNLAAGGESALDAIARGLLRTSETPQRSEVL